MNDFSRVPTTLDVSLYGNVETVTDTLSKCRVRIFYRGMNRNRTYISEDFAQQLIASLPYTPVKGIFNKDSVDFEDHGENNTDGRIYGIVMADPNFAWEDHLDTDGVNRKYACADVLLFTGLYPEAKLIPGESQSMEIFRGTLQGEWRISEDDEQPYYHFLKGSLVGLQVLGEEIEPCFEGAAFFELQKDIQETINYIKSFSKKKEGRKMDKTLFRISDNEKAGILFDLINPNFNEEGNWELNAFITEVYEDYALCVSPNGYQRVYYTKDGDNITLGDSVPVKIVDATESEYAALEAMKAIGGTYETINTTYNENINKISELEEKIQNYENEKILSDTTGNIDSNENENEPTDVPTTENQLENSEVIFNEKISEMTANFEAKERAFEDEKVRLEAQIADITSENEKLTAFKLSVEKKEKEAILTKYEEFLVESEVNSFKENMDKFSVEDFKKEVCTLAVESGHALSNKKNPDLIFKCDTIEDKTRKVESPAIRLLNKHVNGGNK